MHRNLRTLTVAVGAALLAVPAFAAAQGGPAGPPGPGGRMPGGAMGHGRGPGGVTAILDARRALELTPRQVAQLDSLERVQVAERERFAQQMAPTREAVRTQARDAVTRSPAARDSVRAEARKRQEAMRPVLEQRRTRDSSLSAAAEKVLSEAQRGKWREMVAERRGFERGLRAGRGGPGRAQMQGGRGGAMRGQWDRGPAGGPGLPQGMGGGRMGPGGPGGQAGPDGPPRPPRRPPEAPDSTVR